MTTYWLDDSTGNLRRGQAPAGGCPCEALVLTAAEFAALEEDLPHKAVFTRSLQALQYCKAEPFRACVCGTMNVPQRLSGKGAAPLQFGFYLTGSRLFLVAEDTRLEPVLEQCCAAVLEHPSPAGLLLVLLELLIAGDVPVLQHLEERLGKIEEQLLGKTPKHFPRAILQERKTLSAYHSYYEQLADLGDEMQADLGRHLTEEERAGWQRYTGRAERLHDHVEALREYLLQLRELYQSQIDVQQNKVMSFLTVVTTLFLPLTLVAGWYGMNFPGMLAFRSPYGYPLVVLLCAAVIVAEIIYFKKKKML